MHVCVCRCYVYLHALHTCARVCVSVSVRGLLPTMWIQIFACRLTYLGLYGEAAPQDEGDKCHQGAHQQNEILDCLHWY